MNNCPKQELRNNTTFKTPLMLLGLALLSQGACTHESDQVSQGAGNTPPDVTEQSTPATGEVPAELLENIIADLITSENLDRDAITVIQAESVTWPDGSLGCPKTGSMYTMALVKGYRVLLQSGGLKFDYRATSSGQFRRCRNPSRVKNPVD